MAQGGRSFGGLLPPWGGGDPTIGAQNRTPPPQGAGSGHKKKPGRGTPLLFITDRSGAQRNSEEGREMMGRAGGRLVRCEGKELRSSKHND